jgi:hypothetical protein
LYSYVHISFSLYSCLSFFFLVTYLLYFISFYLSPSHRAH